MKRVLLSLLCLVGMASVAAAQTTYNMSDCTFDSSTANELKWTAGDASFHAVKNNGSTAPNYNTNGKDVRIYANGTLTVTATKPITSIVFNLSDAGLKRLAPITATVGTVAAQVKGDETVAWTGDAAEVTFTVGEKADFGSEGNSKAGQLDFKSVTITYGEATDLAAPTFSPASGTYYEPQTVTISCVTEGATIQYSTDNENWADYTAPVAVNESCTLYAKATLGEESITAQAAYVIQSITTYNSIADMMAQTMPANKEFTEAFKVGFDCQVVYANGQYNYVTDGTGYALFFGNLNLAALNTVKGGWTAKIQNYNGLYEVIPQENLTLGTDATSGPQPALVEGVDALTADHQNEYVAINGVTFAEATPAKAAAFTGTLGEATVNFYNRFTLPAATPGNYNVEGFIAVYNTTVQVYPTVLDLVPEPEPAPELTLDWTTPVNDDLVAANCRYATSNKINKTVLVPNKATNKIYEISAEGITLKYDLSGKFVAQGAQSGAQGTAIGCDEAGNIICGMGWPDYDHNWLYVPAEGGVDAATVLDTEVLTAVNYRAECVNRIIGDMASEEGGIFFYPSKCDNPVSKKFVGVHVVEGAVKEALESQELPAAIDNQAVVVPMCSTVEAQLATGEISGDWASPAWVYTHNAPIRYWDFDANDGDGAYASMNRFSPAAAYGFDVFELAGTTYIVHGYADANWGIGLVIVDREGNEYAKWKYDGNGASSNYGMINAWPREDGYAADIYMYNSGIGARKFTFSLPMPPACEAPVFNPESGEVTVGTEVTISTATEGASIVYTVNDGEAHTATAPVVIVVNEDCTVKAKAVAEGLLDSPEVTASYTVVAAPAVEWNVFKAAGLGDDPAGVLLVNKDGSTTHSGGSTEDTSLVGKTFQGKDVAMTFDGRADANTWTTCYGDNVRFYLDETITITPNEGVKITKVDFITASSSKAPASGAGLTVTTAGEEVGTTAGTGEGVANPITWEGEVSTPLVLKANASLRFKYIEVVVTTGDSGVSAVEADESAPVEYYNLQGIRVENPQGGIFIRRQGNVATKVLVK